MTNWLMRLHGIEIEFCNKKCYIQSSVFDNIVMCLSVPPSFQTQPLANGDSMDELLEDYPSLEREDILACLDYAAAHTKEQVTPLEVVARGKK